VVLLLVVIILEDSVSVNVAGLISDAPEGVASPVKLPAKVDAR